MGHYIYTHLYPWHYFLVLPQNANQSSRLDQETAIEEDEDHFDPDEDARDYDEVARNLPVFCVSSRAYQKLSGRLQKDAVHVDGFTSIEDTEIPRLQEHTKKLTEGGRVTNSRRFLNELSQLLNSMTLWATSDGCAVVDKKHQEADEMFLQARLIRLTDVSIPAASEPNLFPCLDFVRPCIDID